MKKIISIFILMVTFMSVATTSSAQKQTKEQKAITKKYNKLVKEQKKEFGVLNTKYDKWQSRLLDTVLLRAQRIENATNYSDTSSITEAIKSELGVFQDSVRVLLDSFQVDWAKYTEKYVGITTNNVLALTVSGKYVTVPRVLEILRTDVYRGKTKHQYNEVFVQSLELGKKQMYFMRGDDMKYHAQDPIWNQMPYYVSNFSLDSLGGIVTGFITNREGFEKVKPISLESGRNIYSATDAKLYWGRWSSLQVAKWLYQAIKENTAWRHSKQ